MSSTAEIADRWYIVPGLSKRPRLTLVQEKEDIAQEKRGKVATKLQKGETSISDTEADDAEK